MKSLQALYGVGQFACCWCIGAITPGHEHIKFRSNTSHTRAISWTGNKSRINDLFWKFKCPSVKDNALMAIFINKLYYKNSSKSSEWISSSTLLALSQGEHIITCREYFKLWHVAFGVVDYMPVERTRTWLTKLSWIYIYICMYKYKIDLAMMKPLAKIFRHVITYHIVYMSCFLELNYFSDVVCSWVEWLPA